MYFRSMSQAFVYTWTKAAIRFADLELFTSTYAALYTSSGSIRCHKYITVYIKPQFQNSQGVV